MHEAGRDEPGGIRDILLFLGVLVAIGIMLRFTGVGIPPGGSSDPDDRRVVLFAVAAFLCALLFARFFRELNKEQVDFWYYSLAMFGVVMFFLDSWSDRAVMKALTDREESRAAHNEISKKLDRLQTIRVELATLGNPRDMFDRIRRAPRSPEWARLRDSRVKQCEDFNKDLVKRQFEYELNEKLKPRASRGSDVGVPPRLNDPRFMQPLDCGAVLREWLAMSTAVTEATHPGQIRPLIKGELSTVIAVTGPTLRTMSVEELIGYLERAWDLGSAASVLDTDVEHLEARRLELKAKVDAPITRPDPQLTTTGKARLFFWPYVLLSALALKLARRNYLKEVL